MGVLMAWGPYLFQTGFASFEELKDSFGGQWGEHKIFGRRPAGQYLGPARNSIRIRGTIYQEYTGAASLAQIRAMKADVEGGTVYVMVLGDGSVVAPFRIETGERVDKEHDTNGNPLKNTYDFDFVLHDDADGPPWSLWP